MPGSLLLTNDVCSNHSDISTRSLDSKISEKRVSFNKAVRIKQYPWKPDIDLNSTEHLTLPNNRFWFKVYKRKNEPLSSNNPVTKPNSIGSWNEGNTEDIQDPLAPIAEVEDQDAEGGKFHSDSINEIWDKRCNQEYDGKERNNYNSFAENHPVEPPVDYFEDTHQGRSKVYKGVKPAWINNDSDNDQHTTYSNITSLWNSNTFLKREGTEISKQSGNSNLNSQVIKDSTTENVRFPRMMIRNTMNRRSDKKWDNSDNMASRERRSRSHDEHLDIENKELKKADKSVSTEDLNYNGNRASPTKRLFKISRDIATQCYAELGRERSNEMQPLPGRTQILKYSSQSNVGHDSATALRTSQLTTRPYTNRLKHADRVICLDERFSNYCLANSNLRRQTTNVSHPNGKHYDFRRYDSHINTKLNVGNHHFRSNENTSPIRITSPSRFEAKGYYAKNDLNSQMKSESAKNRENKCSSNTVGYVRGRHIHLSSVNINTNRKFLSKNDNRNNCTQISSFRNASNVPTSKFLGCASNSERNEPSKNVYPTLYAENIVERNRKGVNPAKNSSYDKVDWSLCGFQLAPKPENNSVSDSECTIHRRPPLRMYIPGVSYHDRPAVEDDRLSALSDMSRSEMGDGISPLVNVSQSPRGHIRRRHSMPRSSKLKWLKWESKNGQK